MASSTIPRMSLFNESVQNENEHDANTVLTELDKGLRSNRLGVQCEAIVRFPRLFEKYPFPILINSSFLKLSEFFLSGTNMSRFWVLRVCQQSENHLEKVHGIEAFVKRIYIVMHSNDPIARALTLRTFGAISRVIPENPEVHHAIRRALDSSDQVEVEAAIFASNQFAAQSSSFATSMCAKISDMIQSFEVTIPMKLLLIPVLRHMHHNATTANMVNKLCLELLPKYPAAAFVTAIADTLTQLSSRTLIGVSEQVELLLNLLEDLRESVRAQSLRSLLLLADEACVNAWPKTAIKDFLEKSSNVVDPKELFLHLSIILRLSKSPLICERLWHEHWDEVVNLCVHCICLPDYPPVSQAIAILAELVSGTESRDEGKKMEIVNMVKLHLYGLLFCAVKEDQRAPELRRILVSSIRIAAVNAEFASDYVTMITSLLTDKYEYPARSVELMCESLVTLCSQFQMRKFAVPDENAMNIEDTPTTSATAVVNPIIQRITVILQKLNALTANELGAEEMHSFEILSAVVMQALVGCFLPREVVDTFEQCMRRINYWSMYRIGRTASRYGQHYIATYIYTNISKVIISDKMSFFLRALTLMSQAECVLNYGVEYEVMSANYNACAPETVESEESFLPLLERLEIAVDLYWQALSSLRAGSSPTHPFSFQLEFLKIRAQFLQTLHLAATMKNAQTIVPPPAIAENLAKSDYLQKFGYVTNQLRRLVKSLKCCEEAYSRLYKTSFDADNATLEYLQVAEYQCALFTHVVESICYATPPEGPPRVTTGTFPETKYLLACCQRMKEMQQNIPEEPMGAKTISNRHLDVLLAEIEIITRTPLCMPRSFFQNLQSTVIKLSVSPQPRTPNEPVNVQPGSNIVIRVEGVIQHYGKKPSLYRRVQSVQLSLNSQLLTPRSQNEMCLKPLIGDTINLTQSIQPQRDFVSGSFLLPISSGGLWQVTLDTSVIDESGIVWNTGPRNSMQVRVLEDQTKTVAPAAPVAGPSRRF